MLKDRLTASSGEPGSSNDPVLASTHFPLKAAASTRLGQAAGALLPHGRPRLDSNPREALFTASMVESIPPTVLLSK